MRLGKLKRAAGDLYVGRPHDVVAFIRITAYLRRRIRRYFWLMWLGSALAVTWDLLTPGSWHAGGDLDLLWVVPGVFYVHAKGFLGGFRQRSPARKIEGLPLPADAAPNVRPHGEGDGPTESRQCEGEGEERRASA